MIIFRRVFHKNNIENWEKYKRKTIKSISSFLKIKKISCSIDFSDSFRESQLGLALLYHVFSIESHFVFYAMEPVRVTDGMIIEQPVIWWQIPSISQEMSFWGPYICKHGPSRLFWIKNCNSSRDACVNAVFMCLSDNLIPRQGLS